MKQSLSPDVNHTLNLLITPKGRQEPCTKVQSQSPAEQISRIWFFSKIHFLSTLGSVANPQLLFYLYLFGGTGMDLPTTRKCPSSTPTALIQKYQFCNFHAVIWAFYPNRLSPPVELISETLKFDRKTMICINHWE